MSTAAADNVRELNVPISLPPPKGDIHKAIAAIMKDVGGVGKNGKNEQQGYRFRGIADIYLACQPVMAKHGVHMSPHAVLDEKIWERTTKSGSLQMHIRARIEFRFYHQDGSYVSCVTTGEAMDTSDKASNKVMSAAVKYALIVTFAIPEQDPEADADNSSHEAAAPASKAIVPGTAPNTAPRKPAAKAAPAQPAQISPAMEVGNLMLLSKPKGHGWAQPHAKAWLKQQFGVDSLVTLTAGQCADAKLLLLARLESEEKYQLRREMLISEGRVLGDGEVRS
jgi:hypothetical protein